MGCKPILGRHRRVVAALMLGVNGPLDGILLRVNTVDCNK